MNNTKVKIASIHPQWLGVIVCGLFCLYFVFRWNDADYAMFTLPGRYLPAPIAALLFLGLTIYCGVGYTLYRECIVMRLFGLPIWKYSWGQTCAAEYIKSSSTAQRAMVKFRIKSKNSSHPYRDLTVILPSHNTEQCLRELKVCLGEIWNINSNM